MIKYSNTYCEFVIYSDFPIFHDEISEILGVEATKYANKGDLIRPGLFAKNSSWLFSTSHFNTLAIEDVIENILNIIKPKIDELANYITSNSLECKFYVVVENYSNTFPSYYISKDFINVCYVLKAEIDSDIYLLKKDPLRN